MLELLEIIIAINLYYYSNGCTHGSDRRFASLLLNLELLNLLYITCYLTNYSNLRYHILEHQSIYACCSARFYLINKQRKVRNAMHGDDMWILSRAVCNRRHKRTDCTCKGLSPLRQILVKTSDQQIVSMRNKIFQSM